ncbi:MAG: ABC-type transport auxiliary lipoprotein family protein [Sulfuricurvum sp.]|uniref:ABC-type transport auxiliary lipoprotein family protein n=1 Tax=Sulfuricurvum sp. TaxID=2025608 RepID=UPI00356B31EA
MRTFYLFIPVLLLYSGCSTVTPSISEYTILPSPVLANASAESSSSRTLRIASIKTLPSLASKNLYYFYEKGESGHYLYSRWSDTPSVLLERSLSSVLQEKNMFKAFFPSSSSAQSDLILESDLNAFYHRLNDNGTSQGYLDITYRLIDSTTKKTIGSKHFTIITPAPTNNAKGAVEALTRATETVSDQCAQWLITTLKEKQ